METQWDIQNENSGEVLISRINIDLIYDEVWKQSAELKQKLGIWQKRLEDLDTAAVKKERNFLDGRDLAKSEDELH